MPFERTNDPDYPFGWKFIWDAPPVELTPDQLPAIWEHFMASEWLKKRESGEGGRRVIPALKPTDEDSKRFPALIEFLGADRWHDGTPRQPGTLLVFVDEGKLKVCLSDRAQGLVLFLTVNSLKDAFVASEATLRSEDADWREAKRSKARQ